MNWAEDKFDATRQSEDEDPPIEPTRHHNIRMDGAFIANKRLLGLSDEDFGDDWHCHDCGNAGKTPWDPTEGCPRYPCHAFKPAHCATCPICYGWVL